MRSIQVSLKFSVDRILCHPKWIDYTEMCTYLVQPCLRLIHTTLWICCDLRHKVALWIIKKISYYLQCNLALCDSRCDLQLVWVRLYPYLIKPCIWPTHIWSIRCCDAFGQQKICWTWILPTIFSKKLIPRIASKLAKLLGNLLHRT